MAGHLPEAAKEMRRTDTELVGFRVPEESAQRGQRVKASFQRFAAVLLRRNRLALVARVRRRIC